ncbi:hypothetical protein M409DRAFT_49987 [Zasmidium cellare ATCC 36951]|uniref:Uncharacterized protein n=1 Tax=Zasmidium cellare ATCC 36951 TaxID=1080233 RepID=A0A6A6CYK3_ZASCE|nr:uncharacterized protein M409DRAFT_49987 [Zasmidium cellare ATCC 36951]KAF2172264.1 hypothetical protein M409DRAFT_49987 [Zasmidium cellare ATCC 36951]
MVAIKEAEIPSQSTEPAPKIAFISGHIDITPDQFHQHYSSPLETSVAANHNFILSTAKGTDTLALEHLLSHDVAPSRITVYIARPTNPRKGGPVDVEKYTARGLRVEVVDGWHTERDAEMTRVSDYDVLWVRPEEETRVLYGEKYRAGRISGTRKNEERRERLLGRGREAGR